MYNMYVIYSKTKEMLALCTTKMKSEMRSTWRHADSDENEMTYKFSLSVY